MAKLLIVQESIIVQGVFKKLLETTDFVYDIVSSYDEAKLLLASSRYEFAVVERILKDAPNGEIIALFNKHNIAPLVFIKTMDEDFFESFEGAKIVDCIAQVKHKNVSKVIEKLQQLQANKKITTLIVSDSQIYGSYLKENLDLHNFKVFRAKNSQEAYEKIDLHPELSLMIIDDKEPYVNALEVVRYARRTHSSKELKIIYLADESNCYKTSQLINSGADDFLVKEFSRKEFYVRVYQNINKVC